MSEVGEEIAEKFRVKTGTMKVCDNDKLTMTEDESKEMMLKYVDPLSG